MSAISTHVLDTSLGRPAAGVPVRLERVDAAAGTGSGGPVEIATATTDQDGRVSELGPDNIPAGIYRLTFDTAAYGRDQWSGSEAFFPEVMVTFTVRDQQQHYHVPLLLNPFGYSTYRGS
jgi:5-hydroxyisourate hydrolase